MWAAAVLCAALALALALSIAGAGVQAVPQKRVERELMPAAAMASASAGAKGFYGASCAAAFVSAAAWVAHAKSAGVAAEPQITAVTAVLGTPHNDLIKAQICGAKHAAEAAYPDVKGPPALVAARALLWLQLRVCVEEYASAQTALLRANRLATLFPAPPHTHPNWAIEPASDAQNALIATAYRTREFQHPFGGRGAAVSCTTTGAKGLPPCGTLLCSAAPSTFCAAPLSQVLVEYVPTPGTALRAVWAATGHTDAGATDATRTREGTHGVSTLRIADSAQLPPRTGLAADFVPFAVGKCTYAVSTPKSAAVLTSPADDSAVYVAHDAHSGRVMLIHANANGIGVGGGSTGDALNAGAKEDCANQILANHNALYGAHFAKRIKMTPSQYRPVTTPGGAAKPVTIYGIRTPGGGHMWNWHVTKIDATNAVADPEPQWAPWF